LAVLRVDIANLNVLLLSALTLVRMDRAMALGRVVVQLLLVLVPLIVANNITPLLLDVVLPIVVKDLVL
jgi:hypothetical protein